MEKVNFVSARFRFREWMTTYVGSTYTYEHLKSNMEINTMRELFTWHAIN